MGPTLLITIAKTVVLGLFLLGMALLLVALRNLFNPEDTASGDEAKRLRSDVDRGEMGISEESVFHRFLGRTQHGIKHSAK